MARRCVETRVQAAGGAEAAAGLSDVGAGSSQEKCSKGRQSLCPGLETSSRCLGTDSCADRGILKTERKEISRLQLHSLWCFVLAAQADSSRSHLYSFCLKWLAEASGGRELSSEWYLGI